MDEQQIKLLLENNELSLIELLLLQAKGRAVLENPQLIPQIDKLLTKLAQLA